MKISGTSAMGGEFEVSQLPLEQLQVAIVKSKQDHLQQDENSDNQYSTNLSFSF